MPRSVRKWSVFIGVLLIASVLWIGPAALPADAATNGIRVSGTQLVDNGGSAIKLKGVNRSGTEYACQQGWGIFEGPVDQSQIDLMKSWNVNMVRVPLNEHCWSGIPWAPNTTGANYRAAIVDYVNRLNNNGIYVVLDLHFTGPWGPNAEQRKEMPNRTYSVPFWKSAAATFAANPNVMFELYNEVHDVNWSCWKNGCTMPEGWQAAGMQELVSAVRGAGANQPIILNGLDWGHDMRQLMANMPYDPAGQLVAGQHMYNFKRCITPACWDAEFKPIANQMPFLAAEIGVDNCSGAFVTSFLSWLDANGAEGYGVWKWGPGECPTGQYGGSSLMWNWNGDTTPLGAALKTYYLGGSNPVPNPNPNPGPATCQTNQWKAEFRNETGFTSTPVTTRCDNAISFDWGASAPIAGVGADNFSIRWTTTASFEAGTYEFALTGDDGIRLYVDNQLVVDGWKDQAATTYKASKALSAGTHEVKVEYYDRGGNAMAKASWTKTGGGTDPGPGPSPVSCTSAQFKGEYFNNIGLSGAPVVTRCDDAVNFNWGGAAPATGVNADNFGARWTRTTNFGAGTYDFTVTGDDGIRLYVDDALLIDGWKNQAATTYTAKKTLTAGNHTVKVEYFDSGADAVAKASWTLAETGGQPNPNPNPNPGPGTCSGIKADYFNNTTLSGNPASSRCETSINNDWGGGGPGNGVNNDNFSARWVQDATFAAGAYDFNITGDDGIRLFVDGQLVVDGWKDQPATSYTARRVMTAGTHQVKVEYYDRGGDATARASWAAAPAAGVCSAWNASYFNNKNLDGSSVLTRCEDAINNDWGGGGPGNGVNNDNFSARWTRSVAFGAGNYEFSVTADDGIRLYVDGQLVIDQWKDQGATTYTATRNLSAGSHEIKVEYFDSGNGAVAKANWRQV